MGRIIGIGGRLRAGKDTVADRLVGRGWMKLGMSDPLNEAMLTLNPIIGSYWTGRGNETNNVTYGNAVKAYGYVAAKDKFSEVRRLLQVFGTEVGRNLFGPNVWVDIMKQRANAAAVAQDVIVTGIRFPNEVAAIHELGGELWWVERDSTHTDSHASENSVGPEDFDVIIENTGTLDELYAIVDELS